MVSLSLSEPVELFRFAVSHTHTKILPTNFRLNCFGKVISK